jgi:hypothetical protein
MMRSFCCWLRARCASILAANTSNARAYCVVGDTGGGADASGSASTLVERESAAARKNARAVGASPVSSPSSAASASTAASIAASDNLPPGVSRRTPSR